MPVNVKLLKKVRKLIAEEPKRLNMKEWGRTGLKSKTAPPCGTVACLAGWTVLAATQKRKWKFLFREPTSAVRTPWFARDTETTAANLIGLPMHECPFWQTRWKVKDVLAWIDRQIDAASK